MGKARSARLAAPQQPRALRISRTARSRPRTLGHSPVLKASFQVKSGGIHPRENATEPTAGTFLFGLIGEFKSLLDTPRPRECASLGGRTATRAGPPQSTCRLEPCDFASYTLCPRGGRGVLGQATALSQDIDVADRSLEAIQGLGLVPRGLVGLG